MDGHVDGPFVSRQGLPQCSGLGRRRRNHDQPKFSGMKQCGERLQTAAGIDIRHALSSDVIGWSSEIDAEKFENVFVFVVAVKCRRK